MNILIEQQQMPGKKTRTRSHRGRRTIRKTRRQHQRKRLSQHKRKRLTHRKHRGGSIFLDSRRTPIGSAIAGPGPKQDGGPGIMQEYEDYHDALQDTDVGSYQGI